jgi:branched-subunit amino acid transport protein
MTPAQYFLAIFLMSLVTFLPRVLPVLVLSKRSLPAPLARWLSYIPAAVLAALLGPALLVPVGNIELGFSANPGFWVSLPVFIVAFITRSLFATVLIGMGLMALWRLLL